MTKHCTRCGKQTTRTNWPYPDRYIICKDCQKDPQGYTVIVRPSGVEWRITK